MPTARPTAAAVLAAALALLALFATGCGGGSGDEPAPPPSPTAARALPPGRKSVIVDVGPVTASAPNAEDVLDQIVDLGIDTVRVGVFWQAVASPDAAPANPTDPADPAYDFTIPDGLIRAAKARGLEVLLTVSGPPPAWGTVDGKEGSAPKVGAFGQFARAAAERYGGDYDPDGEGELTKIPGADLWSIWNEPNLSLFLNPQFRDGKPYSPILYRQLYLAAQSSIQKLDPGTPILIGETAPTGSRDSVDPIPFARGVLCLDPAAKKDPACDSGQINTAGWAVHPYAGAGDAPFDPPASEDFVTASSMGGLEKVLDQAAGAGAVKPDLPLYITEYGVQSEPDPLIGVPVETQSEYLSITEQLAYFDPRVRSFGQYLIVDDPPDRVPGQLFAGFESGLEYANGAPKPAFDGFRLPLVVRRSADRVDIWGLVRPSREATTVEVRVQDGGVKKTLQRVDTSDAGIFTLSSGYRQGRLWQVRWKSPAGETFESPWIRSYAFPYPPSDTAPARAAQSGSASP